MPTRVASLLAYKVRAPPPRFSNRQMGRASPRLAGFCLNRAAARVRVRSPPVEPPREAPAEEKVGGSAASAGRRIVIVVDAGAAARSALQWALSHAVQSQDTLLLLHVSRPNKQDNRVDNSRVYELLSSMKNSCYAKKPGVQVELAMVEGNEKGPAIVEEARKRGASLLVLGQRRRRSSMTWRLLTAWARGRIACGTAEYCIEHADCMTLAVRRKSRQLGGYVITTKRHKDFWLLA